MWPIGSGQFIPVGTAEFRKPTGVSITRYGDLSRRREMPRLPLCHRPLVAHLVMPSVAEHDRELRLGFGPLFVV